MKLSRFLAAICAAALFFTVSPAQSQTTPMPTPTPLPPPPPLRREMRGVWIATVGNIDWPSKAGLPVAAQKAELLDLFDRSKALGVNAVFFQVRPATDALYDSKIEPWSEYLTGEMGKAPSPFYDPLAFAIEEAHQRGLELHAWFNPYRARYAGAKSPLAASHIARTRPDLTRVYGKSMWLDPGDKEVQNLTARVILDVVARYDIDGVHFDDYFYPYQERDAQKKLIPFPDEESFARYQKGGGTLSRSDWRRENVNTLVSRLHRAIPALKPWVRFGISPFGIWRPGFPAQIRGLDAYEELYADSRKWLMEGWVDYLVPQLYWKIDAPGQSFPVLLQWWTQQNPKNRHIWAGQFTERATKITDKLWPDEEIEYQIRTARGIAGASGTVHFPARSLLREDQGLTKLLAQTVYSEPALVPASSWLQAPASRQTAELIVRAQDGQKITARGSAGAWLWVVQTRAGTQWSSTIVPGAQKTFDLPAGAPNAPIVEVAVSAVDRVGNQTSPTRFAIASVSKAAP